MAELIFIFVFFVVAAIAVANQNLQVATFFIFVPIFIVALRRYLLARKEEDHWRELYTRMKGLELNQQQVLKRLYELEHRAAAPAPAPEKEPRVSPAAPEPAVERFIPEVEKKPATVEKPVQPAPAAPTPPTTPPSIAEPLPAKPPVPAAQPPAPEKPAPPPTPVAAPAAPSPAAAPPKPAAPPHPPTPHVPPVAPPHVSPPPMAARVTSTAGQPAGMRAPGGPAIPGGGRPAHAAPPPPPRRNLEETIVTNWMAKISVFLIVVGIIWGLYAAWHIMSAPLKIALGMLSGLAILALGVSLEKRERYVILGRVSIGGGWATLFATTYAMRFFEGSRVLDSEVAGLLLLFAVAAGMVFHTLRYRSQLVTGAAFLLAYTTVWVGHNNQIYSLTANALLSAALIVLVLRYNWFELEVLGILAAYINHFYWLVPIIERAGRHHMFDQFYPSAFMLIFYWAIFRGSYLLRKVHSENEEKVSTLAALLNSFGLLYILKYQSVDPRLAFRFLLILGGVELALGLLPIARKRRMAFVMLSTIGATLLVIAFPFHYAPESSQLSVWWLALAEVFFLAGIFAREVLFRYFGMLAGLVAAVQIIARQGFAADSDLHRATAFGLAAGFFYLNSLITPRYGKELGASDRELTCLRAYSYVAAVMAFSAVWVGFPNGWVPVWWVALALVLVLLGPYSGSWDLCYQSYGFVAAAFIGVLSYDIDLPYAPASHFNLRVLRFLLVALAFYLCAWKNHTFDRPWASAVRGIHTSLASLLIAALIWFEYPNSWMAVSWMVFALALGAVARYGDLIEFSWQSYAITVVAFLRTMFFNFEDFRPPHGEGLLNVRLTTVVLVATMLYGCAALRWKSKRETNVIARWMQNWAASALLVLLGWVEYQNDWVAAIWIVFALAAALVWRYLKLREFAVKSGLLAIVAVARVLFVNLQDNTGMWHGLSLRLVTVAIVIAVLYIMAPLSRLKEFPSSYHLANFYTWMAAALVMTLTWYEMHEHQPVSILIVWSIFALVLFEVGMNRPSLHLRLQGYAGLAASFVRMWFVNLNPPIQVAGAPLPRFYADARFYSVLLLAIIFYYLYERLEASGEADQSGTERGFRVTQLTSFLGLITLAAIMRVFMDLEQVVIGWAVLVFVLMATAYARKRTIFLHQAVLMALAVGFHGIFYNLISGRPMEMDSTHRPAFCVGIAVVLLFSTLYFAFQMHTWKTTRRNRLLRWVEQEQHQIFFFVPLVMLTYLLDKELSRTMVTIGWGLEGVIVFILGLRVGMKTYRRSGIFLLLVMCFGKVLLDIFLNPNIPGIEKALVAIVLGVLVGGVSFLGARYRETIREYL